MISSLYVHIPFCDHICSYCDFCKVFYNEKQSDKYIEVLLDELGSLNINNKLKTIYIGGGSPSSLKANQLEKLLKSLQLLLDEECEFSIEVNPENVDEEKIKTFLSKQVEIDVIQEIIIFEAPNIPVTMCVKTEEDFWFITINEHPDDEKYVYRGT